MAGHRSCSLYALLRDVIGRINAFPSACSLNSQNLKKYRVVSCVRLTLRGSLRLSRLAFLVSADLRTRESLHRNLRSLSGRARKP